MVESHHAGGERPIGLEALKASPGVTASEMATASAVSAGQPVETGWYRGSQPQGSGPGKPPGLPQGPGSAQRCRARSLAGGAQAHAAGAGYQWFSIDYLHKAKRAVFHPQGLEAALRHFPDPHAHRAGRRLSHHS